MSQSTQFWEGEHPSENTLRQFLKGDIASEATLPLEGHVATCESCRLRLDHMVAEGNAADVLLVELAQALASNGFAPPVPRLALTEQHHPDFETIAAYVDGTLGSEKVHEMEELMSQRPRLAQEVAELRALKEDLRRWPSPSLDKMGGTMAPEATPMKRIKDVLQSSPTKTIWGGWRWLVPSFGMATAAVLLFFFAWQPRQQKLPSTPRQSTSTPVNSTQSTPPDEATNNVTRGEDDDTQSRLLALSNSSKGAQMLLRSAKIQLYKRVSGSTGSKTLALSQRWEVNVGDDVQFHFANQVKRPLYLALFWLAQDGNITPVTNHRPNGSFAIKLNPQGAPGSQTYSIDYEISPPAGVEKIKIFVSTRPLSSTSKASKPLSPLDASIWQALDTRAQSKLLVPVDDKSWVTTTREIIIREKSSRSF